MRWICPVCSGLLLLDPKGASCPEGHRFDRAREGYINLLLANQKRSKDPGDSREMMQSRQRFLQAGYYDFLAAALEREISQCADDCSSFTVLDAGCGEGYYTERLSRTLKLISPFSEVAGTDISREALRLAAKGFPDRQFMVASSYQLPVADASVDMVLRVFAPGDAQECKRILKPDGYLLVASPGPDHLRELKARLYDEVRVHEAPVDPDGFVMVNEVRETVVLNLSGSVHVQALLGMTPLFWRGSREAKSALEAEQSLSVTADFLITCYRPAD